MLKLNRKLFTANSSCLSALRKTFSTSTPPDVAKLNAESTGYNFGNIYLIFYTIDGVKYLLHYIILTLNK